MSTTTATGLRWLRATSPIIPALAVMAVLHVGLIPEPGTPMDEGLLLVYPQLMLHGAVPHRDFQTFYAPGNLWILQMAYHFFGVSVAVERTVGVAYEAVLVVGIFALLRRWGRWAAGAGALVVTLLVSGLGFGALNWLPAVAALAWALFFLIRSRERCSSWLAILAGLLGAGTLTFRPEMVAIALAAAVVMLGGDWRAWRSYALGFAAGLTPLVIHLAVAGPSAVISNVVVDAVFRTGPQRRLPLFTQPLWIEGMVAFMVAGCVVLLLSRRHLPRQLDDIRPRALLVAAVVAFAFAPEALQRLDLQHAMFASLFTAAFLCVVVATYARLGWAARGQRRRRALEVAALVAMLVLLPVAIAARFDQPPLGRVLSGSLAAHLVVHDGRSWPVSSQTEAAEVDATLHAVDRYSQDGQRLFVGPADLRKTFMNESFLYFLLPRLVVSTYFIEMEPGSTNRADSRLASDVASADILVLSRRFENPGEPNGSGQPGSDRPNQVVRHEFCQRFTTRSFEVLTRCRSG